MKRKIYVLYELSYVSGMQYWYVITSGDDLEVMRKLKDLYVSKNKYGIYRVCEVVY